MQRTLRAATVGLLGFLVVALPLEASPRDAQWKQVEEAINKGLPQTAIAALDPIIKQALADKAWGEAVKAIGRKLVMEGSIQGNQPAAKITRLEAEIARAPKAIVPVLNTLLADWYWQYFQQNRWRFLRRTPTTAAPGKDFTAWDLPRLFAEIDRQFTTALAAERELKAIPIAAYSELLPRGTLPDDYRPTLYDFVAHEALAFYASGEQAAAKPEDAFEVPADSEAFGLAEQFMVWQPATTDTSSTVLKAIRLYQALLRFHQPDSDPSAFIDADLGRLLYFKNIAFGETKNNRFKAALQLLVDRWVDHDLGSLALYYWAQTVREEGNLAEARRLALRGKNAHPQSAGGRLCANLVEDIEAKSASIATEQIWNAPFPAIRVRYANATNVYFRAVSYDWNLFLNRQHNFLNLSDEERKQLLRQAPVLAWSQLLPPTADYRQQVVDLPAPEDLKPGFYYLVASWDPSFGDKNNQVSLAPVWVSELALVVRARPGSFEGFVLDARSGEPLADAKVEAWGLDNQGNRVAVPARSTDADGRFSFDWGESRGYLVRASHHGQQVAGSHDFSWARYRPVVPPSQKTVFFTDRAIYRPGQTIQYKGICLDVHSEDDNYRTLAGVTLTVVFRDVNGKEIARQPQRANDYGSFAGSFIAPRDRLLGRMALFAEGGPRGQAWVNVEEYKRPKFQVTLEAPKTAAKLNAQVAVTGHALGYTGAAIDGGQVSYRVVREVRMPWWWGWYGWRRGGGGRGQESQEIAHGVTHTGTDGSFTVEFTAKPDLDVAEKDEPTFAFSIHADVTDSAGETRSADRTVQAGYTALEARLSAADWQTPGQPVELKVTTTSLDGEPQVAEGSIKVHALQAPESTQRPSLFGGPEFEEDGDEEEGVGALAVKPDLSAPNRWPLGAVVTERGFTTDTNGSQTLSFKLPVGAYRVMLETQDRFGKKVTGRLPLEVLDPDANRLTIKVPHLVAMPKESVEPGEEFQALWGTGYEQGRAYIEIEHRQKMLQRYWTKPGDTQAAIKLAVTEAMRGGFTLHVTQVRENRAYLDSRHIDVPWSNKELTLKWEHFTSKMQPGQKETWTAVVTGPKAQKAAAEMVAALYDASLDAFRPQHWPGGFGIFRMDYASAQAEFANGAAWLQNVYSDWSPRIQGVELTYRALPPDLTAPQWGFQFGRNGTMLRQGLSRGAVAMDALAAPAPAMAAESRSTYFLGAAVTESSALNLAPAAPTAKDKRAAPAENAAGGGKGPDLSQISARKNLSETAFFFPQLVADTNGAVRLTFTMPEALTEWRFLGFAHDRECRAGLLEAKTVTAKDLMVQPNAPRFLREGDILEFSVKVSNQSDTAQQGKVRLTFNNALTGQPADASLGVRATEQPFDIPPKQSRSYAWWLAVPDDLSVLSYQAVAASDKVSDGEEGLVPVLSRRMLVAESLPLPIRGPATEKFEFKKLAAAAKSNTLRSQSLTVQMVSNPSWYAVMALPYLMEFPYECTEQTFNRLYANALARSIASRNPRIRAVFDLWRNTPALDSPLEKNQDLKSVMLEETPWVRQAQAESQARRNVGVLFDDNRLASETESILRKLQEAQLSDGAWPWFPGGRGNDYITLYIVTGFGRLRHLGVDIRTDTAVRALNRLDDWINQTYREILAHGKKEDNHLSPNIALYLYGRSFFLQDRPLAPNHREAVDYFLGQARQYWLQLADRQSQGHLALALGRFGDSTTARAIMKSIKERSVTDRELGRFWRETELSWWWYRAPIETQALMIEAFAEVVDDAPAVEDCQVWLLKQKQTQDWKTTKATADAVYALLLRGRDALASTALVEVSLGGNLVKPGPAEAGTGYYEQRFAGPEVKPAMGQIIVKKTDPGVAWGSVHWQYLEDMGKITPYAGTPLKLNKSLYVRETTGRGQVLAKVNGPVKVGDELVVRVELRVDRDMEYVHLKDQRPSGAEPVDVLSGYRYQDGLAYYQTTRDTASHFFIDYLPKGTYVFEYSTRITHRGVYQSGLAQIQCMYAPEFDSHSESVQLEAL